jgi:hypothetical protein
MCYQHNTFLSKQDGQCCSPIPFLSFTALKYNVLTTFNATNKTSFSGKDDIVLLWYGHVLLHDDISNEVKINSPADSVYSKLVIFSSENYKVQKPAAQWSFIFLFLCIFILTVCNVSTSYHQHIYTPFFVQFAYLFRLHKCNHSASIAYNCFVHQLHLGFFPHYLDSFSPLYTIRKYLFCPQTQCLSVLRSKK